MKTVNDLPLMVPETSGLKSVDIINSGVITADAAYEAQASIVRNSIPSGFVTLGELDYDYMSNNENKVKLKTESVAYVNGYEIRIPKGTVVDIGRAPEKESRKDLLFLEVWKSEPKKENHVSAVTGTHYELTDNSVKVEWRIRHVANVEPTGVPELGIFEGWRETSHSMATGQGRLPQPLAEDKAKPRNYFYFGEFRQTWGHPSSNIIDNGLGVCSETDSYAIPMFRLYRKPSCGKSTPFEYSKINPKVDYSKFTKLMKEEKVERVVTENIKGRSLLNLACSPSLSLTGNTYNVIIKDGLMKSNTEYTITLNISKLVGNFTSKILQLAIRPVGGSSNASSDIRIVVSKIVNGKVKFKIPPQTSSIARLYIHVSGGVDGDSVSLTDIMILEGDWTNKTLPHHFEGLKSLGEDDGNLVTVKNGILNDNTYDMNDGTQKLTTFPQVTHVLSENTITPEIQATVKTATGANNPLNKLGTKLDTNGAEKIEFTSITGRTIQNCYPKITESSFKPLDGSIVDGYIVLQGTKLGFVNAFIPADKCLIKPSTDYTMIVNVVENTLINDFTIASLHEGDVFSTQVNVTKKTTGSYQFLVRSVAQLNSKMFGLRAFLSASETGKVKFKIMLLEGNYTKTPLSELPFVEGVMSVGETEDNKVILETRGKNLHSIEFESKYRGYTNGFVGDNSDVDGYIAPVKPSTKYFITQQTTDSNYISNICYLDINGNFMYGQPYNNEQLGITTPPNCFYVSYAVSKQAKGVQMEEGKVASPYESPKIYKQEVYLKEPLRSLPNGIKDEIVGNKIIRKVGKAVLNGSESYYNWSTPLNSDKTFNVYSDIAHNSVTTVIDNLYCDTLACHYDNFINKLDNSVIIANHRIHLSIKKDQLNQADIASIKAWLQQHPTTVYYELATPIEEYLENVYEKESIKTYQLDAPLRSLPNGVKDEIKDGVLIRRCGEITINGSDSEDIRLVTSQTFTNTVYFDIYNAYHRKVGSTFLCNNFQAYERIWYEDVEGVNGNDVTLSFRINKSKLSPADAIGFKKWLKANPIKVIYELATPIEIPLTEVKPQTADFSLQRQFTGGNWLRELPNGVRDTIENGKVKRRIDKVVLDGSETWIVSSNTSNDYSTFYTTTKTINSEYAICSNNFPYGFITSVSEMKSAEGIYAWRDSYNVEIRILTSKLTQNTIEGFKTWLSQNPITVLYELKTVKEETLTTKNCNYYPCHDLNTYCGSMYVGEGRNYILSDNKMPSEDSIVMETDFRKIEGKAKVEDCNFKKSEDGYDTLYVGSKSKNLALLQDIKHTALTEDSGNLWTNREHTLSYEKDGTITWVNNDKHEWSDLGTIVRVKPNTKHTFSLNLVSKTSTGTWNLVVAQFSKKPVLDSSGANASSYLGVVKPVSSATLGKRSFTFTTPNNCCYIYCMLSTKSYNTTYVLKDFMINEGDLIDFELGLKSLVTIENTEENDIEDLRHQVSLTGFNYDKILNESFDKLLRGEL